MASLKMCVGKHNFFCKNLIKNIETEEDFVWQEPDGP